MTAFRTERFIPSRGFFAADFGVGGGVGSFGGKISSTESSDPEDFCDDVSLHQQQNPTAEFFCSFAHYKHPIQRTQDPKNSYLKIGKSPIKKLHSK